MFGCTKANPLEHWIKLLWKHLLEGAATASSQNHALLVQSIGEVLTQRLTYLSYDIGFAMFFEAICLCAHVSCVAAFVDVKPRPISVCIRGSHGRCGW